MSRQHIPYPPDFDVNDYADRQEERRRLALAQIHPENLLAAVMAELAERPLADHPLQHLIRWMLDRQLTPDHGGELFDGLKQAVAAQVERLLEAVLADPHAWED
jgi:hypothetical protein